MAPSKAPESSPEPSSATSSDRDDAPSAEHQNGSEAIRRRLAVLLEEQGRLTFAEFMEQALYGEGGYYRRTDLPIGEAGDFVTGSSLSPLFGRATARLLRRFDTALGLGSQESEMRGESASYLEAAYGTGAHLSALVEGLRDSGALAGRRLLAWDRVPRPVPEGVEVLDELDAVPDGSLAGLVFSYELFDALPVHRLVGREDGTVGEIWVVPDEKDGYQWEEGELSDPALANLLHGEELAPGQVADLAPGWAPLYRRLAGKLGRGLLVTCDYGYERRRLLDPRVRRHGTLACYTEQRVHRNPFVRIGRQDLTAHVDFTALREAGEAAGFTTLAFTRQALWLAACGLFDDLAGADAETRQQAMALLDGEGMGQDIRVLVQGRGVRLGEVVVGEMVQSLR